MGVPSTVRFFDHPQSGWAIAGAKEQYRADQTRQNLTRP
jgi:hypothetical protein